MLLWLNHVGEALAGAGEPPVAEDEDDCRDGCEIRQATPVRAEAVEEDLAIVADQVSEGVQVNEGAKMFGHDRFGVDDRREIKPGH